MSGVDILASVKSALGITGNYQNATIQIYIDDVKDYMANAGIDTDVINSTTSLGVIARGVADIWNLGSGDGKLSPYFYERVIQLALKNAEARGEEDV